MQFLRNTKGGLLGVIILMGGLLFTCFPKLFQAPNEWVLGDTYDGFRSYAAAYYHVKHDSSYWHYEGMHYPYGDLVGFTDNLPLLSNTVKFISQNVVDISDQTGGALNLFLLLSTVLCAVFLYLIFSRLALPNWYSIPLALALTMLSPQIERLGAHYGLAHPFVIPLMIWLAMIFHEKRSLKISLWIAFSLFLIAQIHFYLFAIGVLFLGGFIGFKTLYNLEKKEVLQNSLHLAVQTVLPYILLMWLMNDTVTDRPSRPYGFLEYRSYWENVFLPVDFQIGRWINEFIAEIRPMSGEGKAFIGLVAVLFFFRELILQVKNRARKRAYLSIPDRGHRSFLIILFWAALVLLIFSFGTPFIIPGLENLPYKLGAIGQFRSVGRFAWIFFYVINIIAFYALYFQIGKLKHRRWKNLLYFLILGTVFYEGSLFLFEKNRVELIPHPEQRPYFKKADNIWLDTMDLSEYQAIIPIPFFHQGSENIWKASFDKEMHRTLWATVQTGLPTTGAFLGRTSVSETINQLELVLEPYRVPAILEDLPNDKDFLVMLNKKAYENVWYYYNFLFYYRKVIYEDEQIKLYRMTPGEVRRSVDRRKTKAYEAFREKGKFKHDLLISKDSLANYVYKNFDESDVPKSYRGGGFAGPGKAKNTLFTGTIPGQIADGRYVFSLWVYIREDLHPKSLLRIEEWNDSGGIVQEKTWQIYHYIRSMDGDWALIDIPFRTKRADSQIKVAIFNNDLENRNIFVDELQIRTPDAQLFRETERELMNNNRWFGK